MDNVFIRQVGLWGESTQDLDIKNGCIFDMGPGLTTGSAATEAEDNQTIAIPELVDAYSH